MRTVLQDWNDPARRLVWISGWLPRFGRHATTKPVQGGAVLTLPTQVIMDPVPDLALTLIHESSHGTNAAVVDNAMYGTEGFRLMPGAERLLNAYHFDGAARAHRSADPSGYLNANMGNPNVATGAAAGAGNPQQPKLGREFQRVQSLIMHARIQSENNLQDIVEHARVDSAPPWLIGNTKPMKLPIHDLWFALHRGFRFTAADIDQADRFAQAATALHQGSRNMRYAVAQGLGAERCHVAGGVLRFEIVPGPPTEEDTWRDRIVDALLAGLPPLAGSGADAQAIKEIDGVYHQIRGNNHG